MPKRPPEHPNPWPEHDPRDVETSDQRPEEAPAADPPAQEREPDRSSPRNAP